MSGEDNNDNISMMEMMKLMLTNMGNEINSNMNNLSNDINNVRDDMNNDMANVRFESLQERIASRAGSRAVSPSTLQAKLKAKIKVEPIDLATGTPRAYAATRISFKTPSTTDTPNKDFLPSKLTTPYKCPYVVLY